MQKIKLVVLIAIIMFLSTTTPVSADNQAELAVETKVRVNVDGQLYQLTGYDFEGEYYFKRADMSQILPTINISDVRSFTLKESTYFSMRDIARNTNIAYEYDGVLTSCYIWTGEEYTDMGYGDFERAIATGLVDANVRDRTDEVASDLLADFSLFLLA